MMGEIDTKPIEPVQVALSLFEDKADPTKQSSTSNHVEKEKEKEELLKDLANCKLQLEAKDSAYMQALLKLEYKEEEFKRASTHVTELESKLKELSHVLTDLKAAQDQLYEKDYEVEDMKKQLGVIEELECQVLVRTVIADYIELELARLFELLCLSNNANSDAENELKQLKLELNKADGKIAEIEKREIEAQVEIALLKSELHRERSRIASAEAAEARIKIVKSGLYRAVEAEKVKIKMFKFKQGEDKVMEESESDFVEITQANEAETETEQRRDEVDAHITISCEEYESLIKKAEEASELQNVKKELEVTMGKMAEFRNRAEQAITRAEAAEKAKRILGDQVRKWEEQRERRRAAFAALREECEHREYSFPQKEKKPAMSQPLGKVLNMEF